MPPCLKKLAHIYFALVGLISTSLAIDYIAGGPLFPGTNRIAVAVLGFDAGSDDLANASWRVTIQDLIKRQLQDVKDIYVSPDTDRALRTLQLKAPLDENGAMLVGNFLKVDWVVWGTYKFDNNKWSLKVYFVKVNNARLNCFSAKSGDLFDVRDEVTFSLLKEMGAPVTETEKRNMLRRWTVSAAALREFSLAEMSSKEGQPWTNAEIYLREAIRLDPQFSEAYRYLASILYDEREDREAIVAARRAVELRPDYADAHEILAIILASENRFAESATEFQIATRLDPDGAQTFERLGELYMEEQFQSAALTNFERAVALAPFFADARASLGAVYANDGAWKNATLELDAAAQLAAPADMSTEEKLCIFYAQIHQFEKAIDHGEKFLNLAKPQGEDPLLIQNFQDRISQWQSMLTPFYFTNQAPRHYTESVLNATLRRRFNTNELSLIVNPLATNAEIARWAAQLTAGATNDLDKAQMLFNALVQHPDKPDWHPYTAEQVYSLWDKPGVSFHCQEYAWLYVALARCAGLQAYNVDVQETCVGENCLHACAAVFFGERYILVDPAYCYFGAPHRKFTVLDDLQSIGVYLSELEDLRHCQMGFRLAPGLPLTKSHLLDALLATNRVQEATEMMDKMITANPKGWITEEERARIALYEERYDEAIEFAKVASTISPRSGIPHLILAEAYFKRNMPFEAGEEAQSALGCILSDNEATTAEDAIRYIAGNYYEDGIHKYGTDDLTAALTNFNTALKLKPDFAEAYAARGCVDEGQSNLDGALADFERAIQLKPDLAEAYVDRGGLEQKRNDLGDALADYSEGIRLKPDWGLVYGYRGCLEKVQGDLNGAEADIEKAVELNATWATNAASEFRAFGWSRYERLEYTNALFDFQRACKLNPSDDYAHFGIWLCSSLLGKSEEAARELGAYMDTRGVEGSNDWPGQVGRFLANQITEQELLKVAESADVKKSEEQHCEAYFYIGSKHLIAGDNPEAATFFKKCLATGVQNFSEYQSAKAELRVLEKAN